MKDEFGERRALLKALERLEGIFGVFEDSLPGRGPLPEFFLKSCLLPEDTAAISMRLNALADKAQLMQREAKQQAADMARSEEEAQRERQAGETLETKLNELREQNAELFSGRELLAKQKKEMLKSLMAFRDRQLLRLGMAKQDGDEVLQRLFGSLCKECLQMLEQLGVAEMPAIGVFDSAVHVAAETRLTPDASLSDTIAEVYRPGYFLEENVLRPQEVILYKYEAGSEE